jgi:hypothetical protein
MYGPWAIYRLLIPLAIALVAVVLAARVSTQAAG